MMTDTPRTEAAEHEGLIRGCATPTKVVRADFARQLERDIAELNERLIERQKTLMEQAVKIQAATRLLTRCRDSAGRMEMELYMDIQYFLNS